MRFVPALSLIPGMIVGRDVISNSAAHMLKKGTTLTESYIEYIIEKGYLGIYISDRLSEEVEYVKPIDDKLFREGVTAVQDENIGSVVNISAGIVSEITSMDEISMDLFDLRSYDDYTYHHSVNVAVYSVAVGKKLGLKDSDLVLLSEAAICHDLGKRKVPDDIINKAGRLTDGEFALVKNHPRYSFDILSKSRDISAVVKQAVLMHHENENGSGYPMGKEGKHIPIMAKIIHAVDVYDALTSKRPYKDPFSPADAFEYIKEGRGILFDEQVVEAMTKVIPAYPPGIEVVLSDGRSALVIAHTDDALRPRVMLLDTEEKIDLSTDEAYKDVTIVSSTIMPTDYVGDIEELNEDRSAVKEIRKRASIIVVDDVMLFRTQISAILKREHNITAFESGLEALAYIKQFGMPDLFIMDIEMPMLDGISTVQNIRRLGGDNVPVIFLSAIRSADVVLKCRQVGAVDYIVKPVSEIYLRERVSVALGLSQDT